MPKITGYAWGSTEFVQPEEDIDVVDPIEQAELQAEQDEATLWGL